MIRIDAPTAFEDIEANAQIYPLPADLEELHKV